MINNVCWFTTGSQHGQQERQTGKENDTRYWHHHKLEPQVYNNQWRVRPEQLTKIDRNPAVLKPLCSKMLVWYMWITWFFSGCKWGLDVKQCLQLCLGCQGFLFLAVALLLWAGFCVWLLWIVFTGSGSNFWVCSTEPLCYQPACSVYKWSCGRNFRGDHFAVASSRPNFNLITSKHCHIKNVWHWYWCVHLMEDTMEVTD